MIVSGHHGGQANCYTRNLTSILQRTDSGEGDAMMYRPAAPPLPLGQTQGVVVPQELRAQPLWQNGTQLREYLRKLLDRAAVLKAV